MIYLKDGNIPLNLAYDDDIVQEANSTYQLSFKFPLTDGKWNLLRREVFLLADDLHGEQEFFIFEVKKAKGHVQVYAKQVATLLNYYSINSISVDRVPGQTVMTALAGSVKRPCPFTFFSDILDRHTFNESNVSVMAALAKDKHSIVGQWGGDLVRDKYQVKLLKNGGIENESLFMYKKNLSSYEESENINNLKTRLHLKKTIQGQSEGEADRVIAVTVDSPLIGQYRHIYEADIEVNDQDVTDVASLTAYGQRYFSSTLCDLVENSINLDVTGKSDVSVKMFDTVSVFHERFDVDLRLKITSYHFGPMSKRLKSIGFGKVSQTFGSTVASMVAGSVDKATNTLSASFEQKLQKEIDNANRYFDAEFEKRVEEINDGIEQSRAEAELYADNIKQEIDAQITQVNQSMQAQAQEHDREVANILSKTQSVESLANQAKSDAASAIARANQVKTEAIADARAQVATVSQALNTAKSELQTAIASADQKARDSQASATALRNDLNLQASKILAQAQAQTALTNRVLTVETLADGTRSTVAELSKTVSKATGDIASVTSRTKTVEDTLSQTRTQYESLMQTVNTQTGQIESINRKTADLQSGIDGVTERFENLRVGGENLLLNAGFENAVDRAETFTVAGVTYKNKSLPHWGSLYNGGIQNPTTSFHAIFRENFEGIGPVIEFNESNGQRNWKGINAILRAEDFVAGNYMFSADVYATGPGTKIWFGFNYYNKRGSRSFHDGQTTVNITTTNSWHRVAGQIKLSDDIDTTKSMYLYIYAYNFESNSILYLTKPQLEYGTIATQFRLAQETLRSEIATYKRTADEASAELSRQIQLADGKAVDAKTYAQQTATAINTRLESLETYKNEEGTRANQYLTASRTETAKQLSAERAAIATNYVAKSTYDENVRGTALKLNEIKTTADTAKQNLATYQNTVDGKLEELTSSTQTLDGKISTASTKITQNANEISKRLTSTQVDKAITDKGYQTKSDVDNNITGRGYITSSALQPYALSTTVQNLVQETAGSFERQITETRGLIPTEVNQNLFDVVFSDLRATGGASFVQSDDGWIEVTIKNRWSGFRWLYSDNIKPSEKQYVLSYEAYLVDTVANTAYLETDFGSPDQSLRINKTPKRYTVVLNRPANIYNYINFVCNSSETGKKFRIRNIKLEEGIVATPYIAPFPTTVLFNAVKDTVDAHKRLIGNGDSISQAIQSANKFERSISSGGDIYQAIETAKGLVTEVSGTNGLKTQVSTLAGSYAVKNLTSSGKVLNQLNLNKDGSVKIDGSLVQITGRTYIQDGVITSAKIGSLDAGKISTGTLNAARIAANSITGSHMVFDQAFVNKMTANEALFKQLFAKNAFITSVQAVTLSASQITGGLMRATNGAMEIDFNNSAIDMFKDGAIRFHSGSNAIYRQSADGIHTAFVHFDTTSKGGIYASLGSTSSRDGINSKSSGRFAGIRVARTSERSDSHVASQDAVELYGDTIFFGHGFEGGGFSMHTTLTSGRTISLNKIHDAIINLCRCWIHLRNVGFNPNDAAFKRALDVELGQAQQLYNEIARIT
ncbi:TPA: phage tail spike protein [Streptococcus suis]